MTDSDWIKQLQSMMERHEEPVGDDLWQDIEARLPEHQASKRVTPVWRRYAAAAAVAAAVIITFTIFTVYYRYMTLKHFKGVSGDTAGYFVTVSQSLASVILALITLL